MGILIGFILSLGLWMVPQVRVPGPGGVAGSAPAACSSVLATDSFTRANESPLAGNWTTVTSFNGFVLTSNQVLPGSDGSDSGAYYNAVTPNNDQCSKATVAPGTDTTASNGTGPAVCVRCSTSAQTGYFLYTNAAVSNNLALTKWVAGTPTTIWNRTSVCAVSCTLEIRVTGTTIKAFVNGSQVGADSTDSSIASGRCGIGYSSTSATSTIDDWSCANY